ncbi:radical SAM protein [Clostridium tyrobutyricum]|jgi:wyosine [tRNA(Phe)-imidazoG37] synthetase (radical SAM superfamily)|uniref:radical SAM protein n=1 Tax=Clostridium tyrobutyricum TaxID=1519 RepID=UPI00030CB532|nr:radical SAM protein [Clostridium tyrobutyricum]MBV4428059.1 radical SAM protein [Clostridium tyrobutyricum]MBV4437739.1 radical SAM protein [Clostridium tyrobutyricum]MBV4443506.1 radical SAM protein [Clostridium tyrobutyricum]MCH4201000.1 radical SAM protein [Clostridium tyrobutyricum]MCH4238640.1 radical SAM protein [Clostridium tyrobutyricum]
MSAKRNELTLKEVIDKYNDVSPFVIIKADVQRRSVIYTDRAIKAADKNVHQLQSRGIFFSIGEKEDYFPVSLLLRDGTSIMTGPLPTAKNPYVVDYIDGKFYITDNGEIVEEVEYWTKPDYYEKFTSRGTPMWHIATSRPQRIDIDPYSYCHFWDNGKGCKYCNIGSNFNRNKIQNNKPARLDPQDVYETVKEALKEPGRLESVFLTAGSILSGDEIFDDEVNLYIDILQAIGENFKTKRFPSQMISSAFNEKQLQKIYENTGIMSFTSDIEVLDEEKFKWICPGKDKLIGYKEWKRRIIAAVDIFGRGNVNSGIVGGVELAKPYGFKDEDEAFRVILEEAEKFAEKGVSIVQCVWTPYPGSVFQNQENPSLEYYVKLSKSLDDIRRKYGLNIDMDNYRRCGNHPDTDLSRVI